jgi:CheY-like chemotaxis protein
MRVIKVLLVDDIRLFLEFEQSLFERMGCQVCTARSGEEALATVRTERPDIVLLDWQLDGMKGDAVCRILKQDPRTKHIPILVVTNYGHDEVRDRCLAAGATGFLAKPVPEKDLLLKVAELLDIPHRVFLRAPLSIEICLQEGAVKRRAEGYSEDVSETGMLLEAPEYIPRGSELEVRFVVPGHPEELKLAGDVVRTFEKRARGRFGVGVRFGEVPRGAQQVLRDFVRETTG